MVQELKSFSEQLASLIEAGATGVVRVEGRPRRPSSGCVWSETVVMTANHTLDWDEEIRVGLADGRSVEARLVGRDASTDLAALELTSSKLSAPPWSEANRLKVGHLVIGLARVVQGIRAGQGIVSVRGESWRTRAGGRIDAYIETDLSLFPGFSGGMLVDDQGRAVGMNTAGLVRGSSLAVPTSTIRHVAESLLKHGHVGRGYLGLATYPVRLPTEIEQHLHQPSGLLVVSVQPESPAARAGLLLGDTIVSFDDHPVGKPMDLLTLLDAERIGVEARARILRAGSLEERLVTIGRRRAGRLREQNGREGGSRS